MTPETLAQMHAAAFQDTRPWSASEFATLLESNGVILLGDSQSFLLGRLIVDEAEVLTLVTPPIFRRQGHAQRCLAAFLDVLAQQQATSVFLEVSDENVAAKSLYSKYNFHNVGTRPNYYAHADGTKVAAIIMRHTLISNT
ncbi:GNAT family N-acetyltransferase [Yoonia sp.]|uniref:GNAT family N-acetyltransferase n=1 Tax=Yoonia sp. TaxID=2212373 RepID=UPI00289673F3|nr:GNAT family N-acetyltransferase [Yoonia sp.]